MRRMIPHALLAVMTVLALLALIVSLSTADKISSFPTPKPGAPTVVAAFHRVVQRSLDAPSFVVDSVLHYRGPDRTEVMASGSDSSSSGVRVIGTSVYLDLGHDSRGHIQWGRGVLSPQANLYYGPLRATQELNMLLADNSVARSAGHYIVHQVSSADAIAPGNPGQLLITYTVYVVHGYVTGVMAMLQGWVTILEQGPSGATLRVRVDQYQSPGSTYGNYARVAPIGPPSATQIILLSSCANGGYAVALPGHAGCSIFG